MPARRREVAGLAVLGAAPLALAAGGTQPLHDWNGIRIGDERERGVVRLQVPRDRPHKGTFKVYVTKAGYDPTHPPAWSDLDLAHPVATATDPVASGGF